MGDGTGGSHGRRGRLVPVLATVLTGTALLASCGGGPAPAGTTAFQQAQAYARCMRAHGEPRWPSPDSQGQFLIAGKGQIAMGTRLLTASQACQHLLLAGGQLLTAQVRRALSRAQNFAACMRRHGIADFPGPVVNSQGVIIRGAAGYGLSSARLRSAGQICQSLLPGR
ncbi:MAG TPA: hypothetical protein VIX86_09175 [Streptosporangiaceae bacterium]